MLDLRSKTNDRPSAGVRYLILLLAIALISIPANLATTQAGIAASKIAVLVNRVPITSNDIKRRAAFFKLRRAKGNHRKQATKELIDEALQMQEAKRLGIRVKDSDVESAYRNFAKRNKMPLRALDQIMARSGFTKRGFKQFIRAQMTWQRVVGRRYQVEGRPAKKSGTLDFLHGEKVDRGMAEEYTIQQIVFVIPRAKLKARSKARTAEANGFRTRFRGCDTSLDMASQLKDVSVINRGRVQSHELPPRWAKELLSTSVGKTTRPLQTEKGVELLAVCKKREVLSTISKKQADLFSGKSDFSKEADALSKKYMAELHKIASIKYR